ANSEVCVFTSGGKHYVQLLAVDAKIPQTASFAPFGGTMEFLVGVSGEFPVPLFTSGTLELHELDGVHTLPLGGLLRIRGLVNSSWAIWYRASLSGTVVLNFQPTE
ncbi:MAG TPA: hypothetical protein VFO79_07215, partial [Xanthomonadales bacterium]|nr:hypothetical protein [Xanthomonadales bacterium]